MLDVIPMGFSGKVMCRRIKKRAKKASRKTFFKKQLHDKNTILA
jgi:hypothetical protein